MANIAFIVFGIIIFNFSTVQSCSCFPSHPQQLFCDADYVVRAMVTSVREEKHAENTSSKKNSYIVYGLTLLHVYRGQAVLLNHLSEEAEGNEIMPDLKLAEINVTTLDSECGVSLNIAESYLVMGQVRKNTLEIDTCNFITKWAGVTNHVNRGIHGDYDCRCNVETRMTTFDSEASSSNELNPNVCYWNMHPDERVDECALNFLTCRKLVTPVRIDNQIEGCVWIEGQEYEECKDSELRGLNY